MADKQLTQLKVWRKHDLTGHRFGRLVVLHPAPPTQNQGGLWQCQCDCGKTKAIMAKSLTRGDTTSCGCFHSELVGNARRTHGKSKTNTYKIWTSMHGRCRNPSTTGFKDYGARGITVCERWSDFENFLADMGERPKGTSIERRNFDGHYEPNNCYWATDKQQQRNKRNNVLITARGETKTLVEWSEFLNIRYGLLSHRWLRGWPHEEILFGRTKNGRL